MNEDRDIERSTTCGLPLSFHVRNTGVHLNSRSIRFPYPVENGGCNGAGVALSWGSPQWANAFTRRSGEGNAIGRDGVGKIPRQVVHSYS
jgi:hypothetical protein